MSLAAILNEFQSSVQQVDSLVANAHKIDSTGTFLFPAIDREQITVAALLNLFIAWESFLEESLADFMIGSATISGRVPVKYVNPPTKNAARTMIVGINRYFDFANIEYVKKIVSQYFEDGYPYEPNISAITVDLSDLRIMRNASAHISNNTQKVLETLAQRLLQTPKPNIKLYELLTAPVPTGTIGATVLSEYKDKLLVVAGLIAQG